MAEAEPKEEWITAAEAVRLLKPVFNSDYASQKAICRRAYAGLIRAHAERFMVDDQSVDEQEVPKEFWWAEGGAALQQGWTTGDFTTWIEKKTRLRAFGVSFSRTDIEKLIPVASGSPEPPKERDDTAAERRTAIGTWLDDSVPAPWADDLVVCCKNAVVRLSDGHTWPHDPRLFSLNVVETEFDPAASFVRCCAQTIQEN